MFRSFSYLHCDLINQKCLITIIVTITGNVIHDYEDKNRVETYVEIESYGVKHNYPDRFHKVDINFAILIP